MKKPKKMKATTLMVAAALASGLASTHAFGGIGDFSVAAPPPDPNGYPLVANAHFGSAPNLAPPLQPLGPNSLIMYESRWLEMSASSAGSGPAAANVVSNGGSGLNALDGRTVRRYCVFPSIAIQEIVRPTVAAASPPWDGNFTLNLVELGTPKTTPVFAPIQVTGPIPPNTTRFLGPTWRPSTLLADPKPWCGQTVPGAPLPVLYLVVNGRPEIKVIWADAPITFPLRAGSAASSAAELSTAPPANTSPR